MLALALAVFVVVMGCFWWAVARGRRGGGGAGRVSGTALIVGGGVVVPAIILVALVVLTLITGQSLAVSNTPTALTIEVTGRQFWWEVRYPERGVVTANEIYIPVGQPVRLAIASEDVIHSVWVPELNGKTDMTPGRTTAMWLQADRPGTYRGICAEFCGVQHANMFFRVVAVPPEQFAAWLDERARAAPSPAAPATRRGQEVFFEAGCASCHAIEGVNSLAVPAGPDLTHFAARPELSAMLRENNRENLAIWIVSPQALKPGNKMPPTPLGQEDLDALVAYLFSLR